MIDSTVCRLIENARIAIIEKSGIITVKTADESAKMEIAPAWKGSSFERE